MQVFQDQYIVITGGAGFIGSAVVRYLNTEGISNIIIADNLGRTEKWKNLLGKKFIDIVNKSNLFQWLEGREREVEAFIHLGACTDTVETDANYLLENNYRYSVRLAEYALTHGHRFIYASSAATYGDGSEGFSDDPEMMEFYQPLNMYGYSKQLFDLWLKQQNLLDKVVGLKYFNVFGPNEYHKGRMASAIVKMVSDGLNTGVIKLFKSNNPVRYKDGEQMRDFIYVKDAASITADFLTNDAVGIYNVGTGKPETWKALAENVITALEKPVRIEYVNMPKDLEEKYQNYTCADISKLEHQGVKPPAYKFEDAVIEYVRDYLIPKKYW